MLGCAGVGIAAFGVHSADVADADGVVVVVPDVGSGIFLVTSLVDAAVLVDDPVVADHGPVLGAVAPVDVVDGPCLVGPRAAAVHDEVQYLFHWSHVVRFFHGICVFSSSSVRLRHRLLR